MEKVLGDDVFVEVPEIKAIVAIITNSTSAVRSVTRRNDGFCTRFCIVEPTMVNCDGNKIS